MKISLFLRGTALIALVFFSSGNSMGDAPVRGDEAVTVAMGEGGAVFHFFPKYLTRALGVSLHEAGIELPKPSSVEDGRVPYTISYDLLGVVGDEFFEGAISSAYRASGATNPPICCSLPLPDGWCANYYLKRDNVSEQFVRQFSDIVTKILITEENNPMYYLGIFLFHWMNDSDPLAKKIILCDDFLRRYSDFSLIVPFVKAYKASLCAPEEKRASSPDEDEKTGLEDSLLGNETGLRRRRVHR